MVEKLDRRVVTRVADVRDRTALLAAVAAGATELGGLDIVVANAGIVTVGADGGHDADEVDRHDVEERGRATVYFAPHGIRVNAVHRATFDTPMLQNDAMYKLFRSDLEHPTREDATPGFAAMHKLPVGVLDPGDISEAVLFLVSDASRSITGQQLKVEAGALLSLTDAGAPG